MGGKDIDFSIYSFLANRGTGDLLLRFLNRKMLGADGMIVVVDDDLRGDTIAIGESVFVASMNRGFGGANIQNYFRKLFARVLRNFSVYANLFENMKFRKVFLLPLDNFLALEIGTMKEIFWDQTSAANFSDNLGETLKALLDRQRPKRKGENYDTVYLRDDKLRFFKYGPEKHSKLETTIPPHGLLCGMNGYFRFGIRFDNDLHFNVSVEGKEAKISGRFTDCHAAERDVAATSHINMFPNGFF